MSENTRDFEEKDASTLAEIFGEAFNDEVSRGMPQLKAEQFIEFSKRPNVKIFVFENNKSEVIAFLTMFEGNVEYPPSIQVIAVKSSFRGKGIGKKLVQKALEYAKALGKKKVKLFTRPWNTAMQKVCVDLGFVPEAYLRKDYLNEDLILYSRFLG